MQKKTRNILAGVSAAGALAGVSVLVIQRQRQRRGWLQYRNTGEAEPASGGWNVPGSSQGREQMNVQQWKSPSAQQPGREQPGREQPGRERPGSMSPQDQNWPGVSLSGASPEDVSPEDQTQPSSPQRVGAPVQGTRYQPHDQPDLASDLVPPIPETGMPAPERAPQVEEQPAAEVTSLAGPLFQYLLAFQAMMDQLRARRRDTDGSSGARSLQPGDRDRSRDILERLENQLAKFSLSSLDDGSLEERMYRLAVKVRDALQNLQYSDADLFRIYGEVRSEACHLIDQIDTEDLDLERVRSAYECAEE